MNIPEMADLPKEIVHTGYSHIAFSVESIEKVDALTAEFLQFILEQLSDLEEINYRAMMGEYIIYYRGRIVGGIYDDRLLVKPTKSAVSYMATAIYELPYEGAKEMLLVEDVDSKEYLAGLFKAMYDELPVHKSNNKIRKF